MDPITSHAMPWQHVMGAVLIGSVVVVAGGWALLDVLFPATKDLPEDADA